MPDMAIKSPPNYLREARIRAGYSSRETACLKVHYSPETIGRHERGDVAITPDDIVCYARGYQEPGILYQYCARCSVGRELGLCATERSLPFAVMRLNHMVDEAARWTEQLEKIAFDGEVDEFELDDYMSAMQCLLQLQNTIQDMLLIGEKRKAPTPERTKGAGATVQSNIITKKMKRQGRQQSEQVG